MCNNGRVGKDWKTFDRVTRCSTQGPASSKMSQKTSVHDPLINLTSNLLLPVCMNFYSFK